MRARRDIAQRYIDRFDLFKKGLRPLYLRVFYVVWGAGGFTSTKTVLIGPDDVSIVTGIDTTFWSRAGVNED